MSFKPKQPAKPLIGISRILGRYPGRTLQRIGVTLTGIWLGSTFIQAIWPMPDQIAVNQDKRFDLVKTPFPENRSINILLLNHHSTANTSTNIQNTEAISPDYFMFSVLKITPNDSPQLFYIPANLSTAIPSIRGDIPLLEVFRNGGFLLTSQALSLKLGLPDFYFDRYISISQDALTSLIDSIGGVQVSFDKDIFFPSSKALPTLDFNQGLHTLTGTNINHLISALSSISDLDFSQSILSNIYEAIITKLQAPITHEAFPAILHDLSQVVDTNLSYDEIVVIAKTAFIYNTGFVFHRIPFSKTTETNNLVDINSEWVNPFN